MKTPKTQKKDNLMNTPLLPRISHTEVAGEILAVAFYRLYDHMDDVYSLQLLDGIKTATEKLDCDLVVIDIFDGEPDWLAASLKPLNGYGACVIIHPCRAASADALESMKDAQASNTYGKAEKLGFLQK